MVIEALQSWPLAAVMVAAIIATVVVGLTIWGGRA